MFDYAYMRYAVAIGCLLAVCLPLLGQTLVLKKVSLTGEALSHTSIAGVALGIVAGFSNPLYGAIVISVLGAIAIEIARRKFAKYADLSIVVVLSFAIALAAILSSFSSSSSFSSYLFGSILLNGADDLYLVLGVFAITVIFVLLCYKKLMYITYNEQDAKLSGIHVGLINFSHTIITALVISLCAKTIGALLVTALLIIPVASALLIAPSYRSTTLIAILYSLGSVLLGFIISYYLNLQAGGSIVMVAIALLLLTALLKPLIRHLQKKRSLATKP